MKSSLCHIVSVVLYFVQIMFPFRSSATAAYSFVAKKTQLTRRSPSLKPQRRFSRGTHIVMMPEGPEVRVLVDQLQGAVGRRLTNVQFLSGRYVRHGPPDGWNDFHATMSVDTKAQHVDLYDEKDYSSNNVMESSIDNSSTADADVDIVQSWNCKGKFMFILLDQGKNSKGNNNADFQRSIWVTLGMTGRFVNHYDHLRDVDNARWYFELVNVSTAATTQQPTRIYYHDARNFGTLKFSLSREALVEKLQSLGPDILYESTTEDEFMQIVSVQKPDMNICRFLMDQTKISGIGNYMLAEGLYRAGIDPFAPLEELDELQQRILFRELQAVAQESYQSQGRAKYRTNTASSDDESELDHSLEVEFELQCYGRETCARGKPVRKEVNGPHGRTIWYTDDQLFLPRTQRERLEHEKMVANKRRNGKKNATEASESENAIAIDGETESLVDEPTTDKKKKKRKTATRLSAPAKKIKSALKEKCWQQILASTFESESFQNLATFLEEERAGGATIYPPEEETFAALNLCPFDHVKVVIVGQDPYHGPNQGHGLAFSVRRGVKAPPSLQNIFREAIDDVGIEAPKHGNLEHWARQGVLLLNTVLTVRKGEANSHAKKGWEEFTDEIIKSLNEKRDGLVFLLWGNPAAKKAAEVDDSRHAIIRTSHPSPLGATKTSSPFLGSRCFSRANKALIDMGLDPIDWNVE